MVACTCMSNIMCIVGPIAACVSDWLTADSDVFMCMISWIRPPCEITDQLAVGT